MYFLLGILIVAFLVGAGLGAYAIFAPKKVAAGPPLEHEPIQTDAGLSDAGWTREAASEFAGLAEAARCDMIFAVAAIDDERSHRLLVHALDDPSNTVALAAAHALTRAGRLDDVRAYAQAHDGPRATELMQLLSLLA
ncbi:MAG: hypothetical protein ABR584_06415 [Candidatus Baltobacteraceae bacterium]